MRIKKIDQYIFKEVLSPFLAGVVFFAFVFLLFQMLRMAEELIVNNAPLNLTLKLLGALIVNFMPLGVPVAFLVGVLFAFSRLSGDSEIVAMKAGGMSMFTIARPVFVLSFLVSLLALFLTLNWAPWSEVSSRNTLLKIGNRRFASAINEGTFTTGFFNLLLFTEKVNNRAGRMEKVFIFDERDQKHPLTVISKTGELIRVQSNEDDLGGLVLQLQDGTIHQSDVREANYNKINFQTYQIFFDIPDSTGKFGWRPKMYKANELIERMDRPGTSVAERRELDTEFWRRISIAIVPILFVFLGIGFGVVRTRGARFGVMIVAFVTMGVYWQLQVSAMYLGEQGTLPPWMAMSIPNLVVGIIGIFAFRRSSW
jgi:lipopolysaccharide export system permease protein